ncbi:hypothetical protein F5I97DRAFT_1116209 [Phlebopus sp. FC_14]|nr:hypothetical protein F5I97DRAFT_1116209 [Phlebopus sp. FC_14]
MNYRFQCDSWMARAKSVPLVLAIRNCLYNKDPGMLDWLQGLIARCVKLHWNGLLLPGLLTGSYVMERLERLEILTTRPHLDCRCINIASNASKLRSVYLSFPNTYNFHNHLTLPWAQLTSIEMYQLHCTDILRLFELCTHLEYADFTRPYGDDELQTIVPGSVVKPSFKLLAIQLWEVCPCRMLFDVLVLPSLEELEVISQEYLPWLHTEFTSFLTRSRCPLRRLEVHNNKFATYNITVHCQS